MSVTAEIETRSRTNVLTVPDPERDHAPAEEADADKTGRTPDQRNAGRHQRRATNAATNSRRPTTTRATNAAKKPARTEEGRRSAPKPIEVVFVVDGEQVKMVPVKRGISDDSHVEITEGLTEGQEVVSGGYKAISRELEDGKKIKMRQRPRPEERSKEKDTSDRQSM